MACRVPPADQQTSPPVGAETGDCPLCGGSGEAGIEATDRNRERSRQRFRYRRCQACDTLWLIDVPEDLNHFYPPDYYELPAPAELARLESNEAHKVALIRAQVGSGGKLVEVGPGAGVFAFGAHRAGFDVTALEMDGRTCRHLRDVVGVEAVETADPAARLVRLPPSRVIAMWHVIEHLPDPGAMLEAAARNLEPGGVLALATPNPQALGLRLLGPRWAHIDAPRHLFLLPLDALTERAASAGLRRVAVVTADPSGREWNRFGWEYALRRRPAAGPAPGAVKLAALAITLVLRPMEHRDLLGAAYTALFRKGAG